MNDSLHAQDSPACHKDSCHKIHEVEAQMADVSINWQREEKWRMPIVRGKAPRPVL